MVVPFIARHDNCGNVFRSKDSGDYFVMVRSATKHRFILVDPMYGTVYGDAVKENQAFDVVDELNYYGKLDSLNVKRYIIKTVSY